MSANSWKHYNGVMSHGSLSSRIVRSRHTAALWSCETSDNKTWAFDELHCVNQDIRAAMTMGMPL